jgi:hypothetical protein
MRRFGLVETPPKAIFSTPLSHGHHEWRLLYGRECFYAHGRIPAYAFSDRNYYNDTTDTYRAYPYCMAHYVKLDTLYKRTAWMWKNTVEDGPFANPYDTYGYSEMAFVMKTNRGQDDSTVAPNHSLGDLSWTEYRYYVLRVSTDVEKYKKLTAPLGLYSKWEDGDDLYDGHNDENGGNAAP